MGGGGGAHVETMATDSIQDQKHLAPHTCKEHAC